MATVNQQLSAYNDFDVIAVHGDEIAHVECKTSAPTREGIKDEELSALAARHYFLQPTFTLLLVDTSSSVQDLADRFDQALVRYVHDTGAGTGMAPAARFEPVEGNRKRLAQFVQSGLWPANCGLLDHREALFSSAGEGTRTWRNIYVGNASIGAKNGLLRTLRVTLRHFRTRVPPR